MFNPLTVDNDEPLADVTFQTFGVVPNLNRLIMGSALPLLVLVVAMAFGCSRSMRVPLADQAAAPILLFNGTGTSPNDVKALEKILQRNQLKYSTADSAQLHHISETQLRTYQLLIVPGGNFEDMGNGLTHDSSGNIRRAVQGGLNYLGICAGAFMAGDSPYNGLNLTGVRFGFYSAESQGVRKAAVTIRTVDGPAQEHYWEDGPQLSGWGEVIAKYPDDTPAAAQGRSGKGWMVLVGVHPEAPESWRHGMHFNTPASVDSAYAATLIDAALNGKALPHY